MARDNKVSGITGQVLNIPVTCHPEHFAVDEYEFGRLGQNKDASLINFFKMQWFWDQYISMVEAKDPYASPLFAKSLNDLPQSRKYFPSWPEFSRFSFQSSKSLDLILFETKVSRTPKS